MTIAWLLLRAYRWPVFVALCAVLAVVHAMAGDSVIPVPVPNDFVNLDVPLGVFSPLLLASLLLGLDPSSVTGGHPDHAWWAFPIHEAGDARGAVLAVVLLAAGVGSYVLRGPRPEQ